MKKYLLTLLGVASVLCSASAAETLYQTTFSQESDIDGWTIIDNNKDQSTWSYSSWGDPGKNFRYYYDSTNDGDDWAITPAITPKEDGRLLVQYKYIGSSYTENMKVYYGDAATIDAMTNLGNTHESIDATTHSSYFIINAKANQPVYIGFYDYSVANGWCLYLSEVKVSTLDGDPADLSVTKITAPETGENLGKQAVKIIVKNEGEASVSKFDVSYKIDDGEDVTETVNHTLASGDEYEYTFSTLADLTETRKLYTITASVNAENDINELNNSTSAQVRNYGDAVEPYFMGFESSEDTSRIKIFDLNDNEGKEENAIGDWDIVAGNWYTNFARTGSYCLIYNYDKVDNGNDWAILEPIHVSAGYHALKFWYSGDNGHTEKLLAAWGTEQKPEAMTNTIVDLPNITQGDYLEQISIFKVEKEQTIYIGFKAYSDKDENWLSIDDISLQSIDENEADLIVSNLTAPGAYVPLADYKQVSFNLYNLSVKDAEATVKVYVDDQLVDTKTESLKAQQSKDVTYDGLLDNVQPGTHTIKVVAENSTDSNTDNNTVSTTSRFFGTPDIIYDFEDGKVPESFQYFVNDDGSLAASALAEYGENGWTTAEIDNHKLFGNYMLVGSTWVNLVDDSEIDRILVFPQVHVDTDDACVVMTVSSFNEAYPVSYRIMANDGSWGDKLNSYWYYDVLNTVKNQGIERVNQGGDLTGSSWSPYKGNDVYVAINLIGAPGDAILIDNIQFHGCSLSSTAVKDIKLNDKALQIKVVGNELNVLSTDAVKSVKVYDVNGRLVTSANAATLSLSDLPKGVYVVKAATDAATQVSKIIR